jgi:hypothetical protein
MEIVDFDASPFLKGSEVSMIISKVIAGRNGTDHTKPT